MQYSMVSSRVLVSLTVPSISMSAPKHRLRRHYFPSYGKLIGRKRLGDWSAYGSLLHIYRYVFSAQSTFKGLHALPGIGGLVGQFRCANSLCDIDNNCVRYGRYAHCWRTSHHIIHMVASDLVCWIGCLLWGYMLQRNKVYEVQKKGYPMALNSESASKFCISCVFKTSCSFCRNSLTCRRL